MGKFCERKIVIMMKSIVLASLITSASAFGNFGKKKAAVAAPAPVVGSPESPDGLGVLDPIGFWDPLGLAEDVDSFERRRAVEIKHGRISMIAFVGMLFQELGVTFPGSLDLKGEVPFSSVLDDGVGFTALAKVPGNGLIQIFLFCAIAETYAVPAEQYTGGPQNLPGGYDGSTGFVPGGYPFTNQIDDPEERTKKLNMEIQNGRAAMLGVTGCMMHSCLDSCDHHFFYPITHN